MGEWMRLIFDILINFCLLAAVSIISGYLIKWEKVSKKFAFGQGVLFGIAVVTGMLRPLVLSEGLIFDGRSVVLSLCGLFFGPIAALTASFFALSLRVIQGGPGMVMGILVIVSSSLVGICFYYYRQYKNREIDWPLLLVMGIDVHALMILAMFSLPESVRQFTFKDMSLIIITAYPALTVVLGLILKMISQQYIRIRESEERFRRIFEMAPIGISLAGTKSCQYLHVNPYFANMIGRTAEEIKELTWDEITHPEDVGRNEALLREYFENGLPVLDLDKRYVKPNGEVVWANLKLIDFKGLFEGDECQLSFVEDITEKKRYMDELAASEFTFRTLFENSADPIFLIDEDKISDCNQASVDFFGATSKEYLIGRSPYGMVNHYQPDGQLSEVKGREMVELCKDEGKAKFEWWHKRDDESVVFVEVMLSKIILKGKILVHALCRDITDRKEMENQLQYMSYRDQLTGVYNRRFFEEELLRMDVPRNLPLTIVMADVNSLKLINDSFGHEAGDVLLMKAAKIIHNACRVDDIVARVGGDEFAILLPRTSEKEAIEILKRIEHLSAVEKVKDIEISIAVGFETKHGEEDVAKILKEAEDKMYKRKLYKSKDTRLKGIHSLAQSLYNKNPQEEVHANAVAEISQKIGYALGLSEEKLKGLYTMSLFHDIGKIALMESWGDGDSNKVGDDPLEREKHPEVGYRIMSTSDEMADLAEGVLSHHENWDGSGYPRGLKGEAIPLEARIIRLADTYVRLTQGDKHLVHLSTEEILQEIENQAGQKLEPALVVLFKRMQSEGQFLEDQG